MHDTPLSLTLPRKLESYKQLTERMLQNMNIGRAYWHAKVDTLTPPQLAAIERYLDRLYEALSVGIGLFIRGPNGTGKTYLAACLCKEVTRRHAVSSYFVTAFELRQSFMKPDMLAYRDYDSEHTATMQHRVNTSRFLVIDDLGKEHLADSGFVQSNLLGLLRLRNMNQLTTVITTNGSLKSLAEMYGLSVANSLVDSMGPVSLEGPNLREARAKDLDTLLDTVTRNCNLLS